MKKPYDLNSYAGSLAQKSKKKKCDCNKCNCAEKKKFIKIKNSLDK